MKMSTALGLRGRPARLARSLACLGLLSVSTTACVTKGKYRGLEEERDLLASELAMLAAERDVLQDDLEQRAAEARGLAAELEATEAQAAQMEVSYNELVGALETEVALGQIEVERVVNGIRLAVSDELLFSSGSAELDARGRELLARVADQIDEQDAIVSVEGHTDSLKVSSKLASRYPTNWELAGARAAIVVRVLAENGVSPEMLRAVSRGPFDPRATNETAEGRARNRRTEILLRPIPKSL